MSMRLTLGTGSIFPISDFGHEHIVFVRDNIEECRLVENAMMAAGALDTVTVEADGQTIATITGMQIAGTQTVANTDGSITEHIYTRGGTYDLDAGEYAQAGRILLGEEEG